MAVGFDDLVGRASQLAAVGARRVLGITGPPAAGKSTLAQRIVDELAPRAGLVSMDGFHLATSELTRRDWVEARGAPHTFDVGGYVSLLRRLRRADEEVVYVPVFERTLELSIGSAVAVPRDLPLIVTEGNYLLVDHGGWEHVRPLLDECWYIELPESTRIARLVARHEAFGRSPAEAYERAVGVDGRNAATVLTTRQRADVVVDATSLG